MLPRHRQRAEAGPDRDRHDHWDGGRHNGYYYNNRWYYGPPPAYVYDEPAYAPRCYYTRGEPVWDSYRGIWVRPRVRVCD